MIGIKLSGPVRFDNPPFRGRANQSANDTLQIIQNEVGIDNNETLPTSASPAWKQETLQAAAPAATEVGPSLYEELRLGSDGVGFKRLK